MADKPKSPPREPWPDPDPEFVGRVIGYLESRLAADELARLRAELVADAAKRKTFVRLCLTRAALIEEMGRRQGRIDPINLALLDTLSAAHADSMDLNETQVFPAMRAEDHSRAESEDKIESPPTSGKPGQNPSGTTRRRRIGWAAAIAIPLLLAIFIWRIMHPAPTVVLAVDAVWNDPGLSLKPGDRLSSGPLLLKSGLVQMEVGSVSVVVQGPAKFEILSNKALFLTSGKLVARVPAAKIGFRVQTPLATIVDLGTEFGVDVQPDQQTHIEVLEGRVSAQAASAPADAPAKTLLAHEAGAISAGSTVIQAADPTPLEFVRPADLATPTQVATAGKYERWRAFSDSLRQDPSLVAYYTFERSAKYPSVLSNLAGPSATAGQYDGRLGGTEAGVEHAPKWATGRWPGKGALEFNAVARTRVELPAIPAFIAAPTSTTAVWVKPDDAEHSGHLINEVATQIDRFDLVWIGGNSPQYEKQLLYFNRGGGPVLFPGILPRQPHWTLLVVTVDAAGMANVYIDGQFIAAKPVAARSNPAGAMFLGRTTTPEEFSQELRNETFGGLMDELALFSRALTRDEVQRMYDAGRPN